jgi:hypothetical protein
MKGSPLPETLFEAMTRDLAAWTAASAAIQAARASSACYCDHSPSNEEVFMAKPNYSFAKRQRELAKKQKKEAKLREKAAAKNPIEATPDGAPAAAPPETPAS